MKAGGDGIDNTLWQDVKEEVDRTFSAVGKKYNIQGENSTDYPMYLHNDTRCRNHYGKSMANDFAGNNSVRLNPLIDSNLRRIGISSPNCNDKQLLQAVIYTRYVEGLETFRVQGGRSISAGTVEYAKQINAKFPLKRESYGLVSFEGERIKYETGGNAKINKDAIHDTLKKVALSPAFERLFCLKYPKKVYDHAIDNLSKPYFPFRYCWGMIAAVIYEECCFFSGGKGAFSEARIFGLEGLLDKDFVSERDVNIPIALSPYQNCRVDVKYTGGKGAGLIFCDDYEGNKDKRFAAIDPPWMIKDDKTHGFMFQSPKGKADLKLCLKGNGEASIALRASDVRAKNGERLPIYIDYTKLCINGKTIFDINAAASKDMVLSHDRAFYIRQSAKDGDVMTLQIEWKPLGAGCSYARANAPVPTPAASMVKSAASSAESKSRVRRIAKAVKQSLRLVKHAVCDK